MALLVSLPQAAWRHWEGGRHVRAQAVRGRPPIAWLRPDRGFASMQPVRAAPFVYASVCWHQPPTAGLEPGDRIRLGIEGDPECPYRGEADTPTATVVDVDRSDTDKVGIRATLDGGRGTLELDDQETNALWVWEIADEDAFRGRLATDTSPQQEDRYRSAMDRLDELEIAVREQKEVETQFRATMASTVRELAGDILRTVQGQQAEFAHRYADRYDLALTENAFRSAERPSRKRDSAYHGAEGNEETYKEMPPDSSPLTP